MLHVIKDQWIAFGRIATKTRLGNGSVDSYGMQLCSIRFFSSSTELAQGTKLCAFWRIKAMY